MNKLTERLGEAADALNAALTEAEEALQSRGYTADAKLEIREGAYLVSVGGFLGVKIKNTIQDLTNAKLDDRVLAAHHLPELEELVQDLSHVKIDKIKEATEKALAFAQRTKP